MKNDFIVNINYRDKWVNILIFSLENELVMGAWG